MYVESSGYPPISASVDTNIFVPRHHVIITRVSKFSVPVILGTAIVGTGLAIVFKATILVLPIILVAGLLIFCAFRVHRQYQNFIIRDQAPLFEPYVHIPVNFNNASSNVPVNFHTVSSNVPFYPSNVYSTSRSRSNDLFVERQPNVNLTSLNFEDQIQRPNTKISQQGLREEVGGGNVNSRSIEVERPSFSQARPLVNVNTASRPSQNTRPDNMISQRGLREEVGGGNVNSRSIEVERPSFSQPRSNVNVNTTSRPSQNARPDNMISQRGLREEVGRRRN